MTNFKKLFTSIMRPKRRAARIEIDKSEVNSLQSVIVKYHKLSQALFFYGRPLNMKILLPQAFQGLNS